MLRWAMRDRWRAWSIISFQPPRDRLRISCLSACSESAGPPLCVTPCVLVRVCAMQGRLLLSLFVFLAVSVSGRPRVRSIVRPLAMVVMRAAKTLASRSPGWPALARLARGQMKRRGEEEEKVQPTTGFVDRARPFPSSPSSCAKRAGPLPVTLQRASACLCRWTTSITAGSTAPSSAPPPRKTSFSRGLYRIVLQDATVLQGFFCGPMGWHGWEKEIK